MTAGILDPTISSSNRSSSNRSTGTRHRTQPHSESAGSVPPRVAELSGLRVGLLENTKRHAAELLDAVGAALAAPRPDQQPSGRPMELIRHTKANFAMPLAEDLVEQLVQECDVVVIGVGDCGSCSAAAVADGIVLESRGLPTAVVCTEAFDVTSRAMARLKGQPDFPYLLMPHPIANLTPDGITGRGRDLAARIART